MARTQFGSLHVSGKLPTCPSPKPTLTLSSHLGQDVGLGRGRRAVSQKRIMIPQILELTEFSLSLAQDKCSGTVD